MIEKRQLVISIGEINDDLSVIKQKYPGITFLSTNGKAASVLRTGRLIGNGKGTTEIQVTGDNKVFSIMVTVTSTQNGNNLPLLIDRHNGLLFDDIPEDLIKVPKGSWLCSLKSDLFVSKPCLDAYSLMATQAAKEGILMRITSAYRSYDDQINILATLTKLYGENKAKAQGAPPGYSEHQLGLALDVGGWIDESGVQVTKNEEVYRWIEANCWRYGFILKNPAGKEHITGGIYEPWHIRYISGERNLEIAEYIHNKKITLNEFLEEL